jgi:hypothetical protein
LDDLKSDIKPLISTEVFDSKTDASWYGLYGRVLRDIRLNLQKGKAFGAPNPRIDEENLLRKDASSGKAELCRRLGLQPADWDPKRLWVLQPYERRITELYFTFDGTYRTLAQIAQKIKEEKLNPRNVTDELQISSISKAVNRSIQAMKDNTDGWELLSKDLVKNEKKSVSTQEFRARLHKLSRWEFETLQIYYGINGPLIHDPETVAKMLKEKRIYARFGSIQADSIRNVVAKARLRLADDNTRNEEDSDNGRAAAREPLSREPDYDAAGVRRPIWRILIQTNQPELLKQMEDTVRRLHLLSYKRPEGWPVVTARMLRSGRDEFGGIEVFWDPAAKSDGDYNSARGVFYHLGWQTHFEAEVPTHRWTEQAWDETTRGYRPPIRKIYFVTPVSDNMLLTRYKNTVPSSAKLTESDNPLDDLTGPTPTPASDGARLAESSILRRHEAGGFARVVSRVMPAPVARKLVAARLAQGEYPVQVAEDFLIEYNNTLERRSREVLADAVGHMTESRQVIVTMSVEGQDERELERQARRLTAELERLNVGSGARLSVFFEFVDAAEKPVMSDRNPMPVPASGSTTPIRMRWGVLNENQVLLAQRSKAGFLPTAASVDDTGLYNAVPVGASLRALVAAAIAGSGSREKVRGLLKQLTKGEVDDIDFNHIQLVPQDTPAQALVNFYRQRSLTVRALAARLSRSLYEAFLSASASRMSA